MNKSDEEERRAEPKGYALTESRRERDLVVEAGRAAANAKSPRSSFSNFSEKLSDMRCKPLRHSRAIMSALRRSSRRRMYEGIGV